MSLPSIGNGQGFPGYDEEEDDEEADEELQEGPRVRRRRLGSGTRLPGVAELDRSIAAGFAASEGGGGGGGRLIKREESSRRIKHEGDRRGSVGSGSASGSSRRSR